ncbi:MAG: hypothetical protein EPO51_10145 [Phenylobacterium sp.]|uniref:hypothetical protein n=1 Tax=Phenylobacterium sp. TaxID=1871053 RepID=UPI0011FE695E|nr:hypothetical protein [Phenylobacterium sp.]TAJ72451.1 MAG: hypothetical protein EPO51_10145 [Phenylobacterium sp.]
MPNLRARQLRALVAAFCVALAALLSAQFTFASVERIEHDLGVQHAANPVAGHVVYDHDDADQHPDRDQAAATESGGPEPASHHHHGDGPQLVILVGDAVTGLVMSRAHAPAIRATPAPPSSSPGGLERPPRPDLERFA